MTGKEFRKWRRNEDITQNLVAEYCDINISTISRWEHELIQLNEYIYLRVMEFVAQN